MTFDVLPNRDAEDWDEEELAGAAYGDGHGIKKEATTRTGDVWALFGNHRIDNNRGLPKINNPLTGERETLEAIHPSNDWIRNQHSTLTQTESGYIVVLKAYTQGAGTRGYSLQYAGPYVTQPGGQHVLKEVLPVPDAWSDGEPEEEETETDIYTGESR